MTDASEQRLQTAWKIHSQGDIPTAERIYRDVLDEHPEHANAWIYLGIALFDRREFEASVEAYDAAIRIRENKSIAWNNRGNSLRMLGRIEAADESFQRALELKPGYLSAIKNRGTLWIWAGDLEQGRSWYQQGLEIADHEAELHRNLGILDLLIGDYKSGFQHYRHRWRMPGFGRPRIPAHCKWLGDATSLSGKRVLLYPEQGLGDAIQFSRVASSLAKDGASVYLYVAPKMIPLFTSLDGVESIVSSDSQPPPCDFHASMIEVVDLYFERTGQLLTSTDGSDEAAATNYLRVNEALVDYWGSWLEKEAPSTESKPLRIGLNWQGNPDHHADVFRSVPLTALDPLLDRPDITWVCLQHGFGIEQLDAHPMADSIIQLPDDFDDDAAFSDSAALIPHLDAVVTSDTAIAHLAGSVGAQVHVILGKVPDWRWGLESDRTPWYPKMHLHRAGDMRQFDDAVASVAKQSFA